MGGRRARGEEVRKVRSDEQGHVTHYKDLAFALGAGKKKESE